jgi:alkanesulfonate monooxygenase SsuD/methylene tetrahydromethanopterin reductase-like flavin-dependent oxidoreductase (luciferase family)
MRVGMATVFQNPHYQLADDAMYRHELALADLIEPLGFDSAWAIEHHFTDYTMCPDPVQFLTWVAARTKHIQIGTAVIVLPWHDPMRVAEQVSLLDHLSGGRVILGIGRGLGRVEFNGFRVAMDESRPRFVESAEMLLRGLEQGFCEYDGKYVKQPRAAIRPAPFKTFRGRTYAAAVSPESMRIMAELGIGILVIPQKPWEVHAAETEEYRTIFREVNRAEPPAPAVLAFVHCDEDRGRAHEHARRYIAAYWDSVLRHYELAAEHLAKTKGYEYYANLSNLIGMGATDAIADMFVNLQVWGTPDECVEKVVAIREKMGQDTLVCTFSYGGMPYDVAERSLRLFAREVRPRLQALDAPPVSSRATAAAGSPA